MKKIHIVGFGSQGSAWAQCLRNSNWNVSIYLTRPDGKSAQLARSLGFPVYPLDDLRSAVCSISKEPHLVALLCPDTEIAAVYCKFLSESPGELRLVLAHGFAVFSGDLAPTVGRHRSCLLAPKAIGPKIWQNFQKFAPAPHPLVAAVSPEAEVVDLARGLGFSPENLVPASFEQETVGDLISEQGLLCGGVFNLLDYTVEAMHRAGIPAALTQEECLSELELIVQMLREKGPKQTFSSISQTAQSGTIAIRSIFEQVKLKEKFLDHAQDIENGNFTQYFKNGEWRKTADELKDRLGVVEDQMNRKWP